MKKNKFAYLGLIIIEYLWLAMAVFTLIGAIIKFKEGGIAQLFAWVFIVLSLMCVIMFFLRRFNRKKNKRK